jgi:hypothetical protein
MSSDPNTPDFDSMSPEEVMAWMETLAKRQGADASGFTTAADETIDEIDPDTVDDSVLSQTYRPDGWSEERWQAQLAKEEEEKQTRLAQQQQAPPEPEPVVAIPEPEPAVASVEPVASDDGTPDYDNMSPEELMEWMESLAKRQGADEAGFMTKAEMDVAEVDPDTVDESVRNQKYIPSNWTEEKWDAHLAQEAAEKQTKQDQPEPEIEFVDEDEGELATLNLDDLPPIDTHEEETTAAPDSPMSWLESLATTDEDSEELDIPDLSTFGDDLGVLDSLAQEDADGDPMDWLSSLAGDVDDTPDLDLGDLSDGLADLEGLEAFALLGNDEIEDEEESLASVDDVEDPVSFLETLAMQEGAPEDELSTDHNDVIPDLDSFFSEDSVDDIELGDFLEDTQPSQKLEPAWAEDDPNSMENPEAWLEALAESSGDDTGQMPRFDDGDDDGDDESLLDELDNDTKVISALDSGKDVSPEDIQNFFASAFKQAEGFAHLDEGLSEPEQEGEIEAAVAVDVPDWLQELGVATPTAQAVGGDDDGEDLIADVLADLENGDSEDIGILDLGGEPDEDEAEQVDIPDWLTDSVSDGLDDVEIEAEAEQVDIPDWLTDSASDSLDDIEIEAEVEVEAEQVGIPDWLSDGAEDDSGDVIADIIADEHNIATGETAVISTESGHQIEVDPNDTWTQAFLMEGREEDAEEWYTQRLNTIDDEVPADAQVIEEEPELDQTTLQMTSPPGAISLEPATLPIEEELPEGQPELAPSWLIGDAVQATLDTQPQLDVVAEEPTEDIPSWLEESISDDDDIAIPDWLSDDDTSEDPIPDWLADAGVSQIEPAAIPSWLTDTVEEPADIVAQVVEPEPEPQVAPISIVPPLSPTVDVSGAIKSAQEKVTAGNLDEALQDYESVVRANDNIDAVIKDLQKLTKNDATKKNPAIYRVLGDAQMRNGDLQTALDTYRRALNLL